MKINLDVEIKKPELSPGDVAICENGSYLLIKLPGVSWPYIFIDLKTFEKVNGYEKLTHPTNRGAVYSGSGKILEIIKSVDLEIKRIEGK